MTLDVVHLQGMTTVVLQFPEEPRYQVDRDSRGGIQVQMLADRLTPPPPKEVQDPLVQGVAIDPRAGPHPARRRGGGRELRAGEPVPAGLRHPPDLGRRGAGPAHRPPTGRQAGIHTIVIDPGHGGTETGADRAERRARRRS